MRQDTLPTVDINFLTELLLDNKKVKGITKCGSSTSYIIAGSKPIGERIIVIRNLEGQVDFDFATGVAIRLKCMSELLEWLKINRKWKDGGYFE